MKILIAHNEYQQRGGEDMVAAQESALLTAAEHEVRRFTLRNDHIQGLAAKIAAAFSVIHNKKSVAAFTVMLQDFRPDIVHIHNFFPTLSPAIIEAAARKFIPVVLTLHNYRLICAGAMLMRDNKLCEQCVGHSFLPGIIHRCYRGSALGSAAVGVMGAAVRDMLTRYPKTVTVVALTGFARSRFIAGGFAPDTITVRGNVIADPGTGQETRDQRIVYVGRLSPEKGVDTLLKAARNCGGTIEIIGDGPERARLQASAPENVIFSGQLPPAQVMERIKSAMALAIPSRWYEGFPMVTLEAMATGTPILASRIGSLAEIVMHDQTGLLLPVDDSAAWQDALRRFFTNPAYAAQLGLQARMRFLEAHAAETGVKSLEDIYKQALEKSAATGNHG